MYVACPCIQVAKNSITLMIKQNDVVACYRSSCSQLDDKIQRDATELCEPASHLSLLYEDLFQNDVPELVHDEASLSDTSPPISSRNNYVYIHVYSYPTYRIYAM